MPVSKEKAKDLLVLEEFAGQPLEVWNKQVYCLACKASIGSEARLLRQHCFQSQNVSARAEFEKRGEADKAKLRHYTYAVAFAQRERQGAVLQKAIALNKERWQCGRSWMTR